MEVIHLISSLRRGGRERQLATLYYFLKKEGQQFKIISMNRANETYVEEYGLQNDVIYLKQKGAFKRLFEINKILKQYNARAVWTWGGFEASFGLFLYLLTGLKHINGSVRHGIISKKKSHYWRMLVLHLSRYRVANSKAGLKANRLKKGFVWYNGIDEKFLAEIDSLKNEPKGNDNKALKFISVANLVPYKDYYTVFKSLAKLKQDDYYFTYKIIGEGPMRKELEACVKDSGLENEVRFLGRISNVQDHLRNADVFIHSSKGEGCSNAILEAMASGLPVVATATGGTPEIVIKNTGFLFPYQNSEELTKHLKGLLNNKAKIKEIGLQSYYTVREQFTTTIMISNYQKLVKQILEK